MALEKTEIKLAGNTVLAFNVQHNDLIYGYTAK